MNIDQIKYFLAIISTGSYTEAAVHCYTSQSTISKQIMALEKELGIKLFDRSKRKVVLTKEGEIFLDYARKYNTIYKDMNNKLEKYKSLKEKTLSLASIPVLAQYNIAFYLFSFRKKYPNIKILLDEDLPNNIITSLKNNKYDLVFLRKNHINSKEYLAYEFCKDNLAVVTSREHIYANKKILSLKELSSEKFILLNESTGLFDLCVSACIEAGFNPEISYLTTRVANVTKLVSANEGISLLMNKVAQYHKSDNLAVIPLEEFIPGNIVVARLKKYPLSSSAKKFIEFLNS